MSESRARVPDYTLVVNCLKTDDVEHLKTLLPHGTRKVQQCPMIVPDSVVLGADKCLEWALSKKAEASTGVLFASCAGIDPQKAANLPPTHLLPIELGIVFDRETAVRLLVKHTDANWFGADLYMRVYRMGKLQALSGLLLARSPRIPPSDGFLSMVATEQPSYFGLLLRKGLARVYAKNSSEELSILYPLCRTGSLSTRIISHVLKETSISLSHPCCPGRAPLHLALSTTTAHVPMRKRLSSVKALLKSGASVNQPCPGDQRSPLHYAAMSTFLGLRRDLVDLLLQNAADPFLPDKYGLFPHDYANPLIAAWLLSLRAPDPVFYGRVPTLKHMALNQLRCSFVRLPEAEQGRFLVALADVGDTTLWAFVKMPCPAYRWLDFISEESPVLQAKKTILSTLVMRKLSIWDHDGLQLPICQQRLRGGQQQHLQQHLHQQQQHDRVSAEPASLCRCTVFTFLRFRNGLMPGQLAVRLDNEQKELSLRYGATEKDLLSSERVRTGYLEALGLDPLEDLLCLVILCVSSLPSIFAHLGTTSFVDLLNYCVQLATKATDARVSVPSWLQDAVVAADGDRSRPLFLPPVAKQDNGVLITDSETFELSEGAIHFEEPFLSDSEESEQSSRSSSDSQQSDE